MGSLVVHGWPCRRTIFTMSTVLGCVHTVTREFTCEFYTMLNTRFVTISFSVAVEITATIIVTGLITIQFDNRII